MTDYTHEIVKIERTAAKSGAPMWRCRTSDDQSVNVFQHDNPERNTVALMLGAGYTTIGNMGVGEVQRWNACPIRVQLLKDGEWWKLAAVEPRPAGAEPDATVKINPLPYRERAVRQAKELVSKHNLVNIIDTESTGLQMDDEMVAAAIVSSKGRVLFNELMQPANPDKLLRLGKGGMKASDVNGITPEKLSGKRLVEDCLMAINMYLAGRVLVAYNTSFDVGLLERECMRYEHPLPNPLAVVDVAQIVSEFMGVWQPQWSSFKRFKLSEAVDALDVEVEGHEPHTALGDALTTLEVLRTISENPTIKTHEFGAWAE